MISVLIKWNSQIQSIRFETSDGQKREEHAQIVVENDEPSQIVDGSYSYVGTDGLTYAVNYHADKNGYVAIISKPHQWPVAWIKSGFFFSIWTLFSSDKTTK